MLDTKRSLARLALAAAALAPLLGHADGAADAWPTNRAGIVFLWENGNRVRSPAVAFDAEGRPRQAYAPVARGRARFGRDYEMVLHRGSFHAHNAGAYVATSVAQAGAFSFEAWVTAAAEPAAAPGRIVSFAAADGALTFALAQRGDVLLCAPGPVAPDAAASWLPIGARPPTPAFHLAVSCGDGALVAWIDGRETYRSAAAGDPAAWLPGELVFGDSWEQQHDWAGRLQGIALYARVLSAAEARANAGVWQARAAARRPAPQLRLRGTLLQRSESHADKLGAYTRALALFEYRVDEVLAGAYSRETVFVFHWTVMHRKLLPMATREVGSSCELLVEPFDEHLQLEPELQFDSLDWNYDQPVYYDVADQP